MVQWRRGFSRKCEVDSLSSFLFFLFPILLYKQQLLFLFHQSPLFHITGLILCLLWTFRNSSPRLVFFEEFEKEINALPALVEETTMKLSKYKIFLFQKT